MRSVLHLKIGAYHRLVAEEKIPAWVERDGTLQQPLVSPWYQPLPQPAGEQPPAPIGVVTARVRAAPLHPPGVGRLTLERAKLAY